MPPTTPARYGTSLVRPRSGLAGARVLTSLACSRAMIGDQLSGSVNASWTRTTVAGRGRRPGGVVDTVPTCANGGRSASRGRTRYSGGGGTLLAEDQPGQLHPRGHAEL